MFASGCRVLISVASAGRLAAPAAGPAFVLIEQAIRDEGTSYHYLPPGERAAVAPALAAAVCGAAAAASLPLAVGTSWTTDAPYRETASAIAQHRNRF